jgi:hypothetical protein
MSPGAKGNRRIGGFPSPSLIDAMVFRNLASAVAISNIPPSKIPNHEPAVTPAYDTIEGWAGVELRTVKPEDTVIRAA